MSTDRPGDGQCRHRTPEETRQRVYDTCRREGVSPEKSRKLADETARRTHDTLNRG